VPAIASTRNDLTVVPLLLAACCTHAAQPPLTSPSRSRTLRAAGGTGPWRRARARGASAPRRGAAPSLTAPSSMPLRGRALTRSLACASAGGPQSRLLRPSWAPSVRGP